MSNFILKSRTFKDGDILPNLHVFNDFGCSGENKTPELFWENAPKDVKSFAVTVYDPDAPTGSGWWHWAVINLPANISEISEDQIPTSAMQLRNDYGNYKFDGACPPENHGIHRYIFTVYALSVEKIEIPSDASIAMAGFNINAYTIDKAQIVATFERKSA